MGKAGDIVKRFGHRGLSGIEGWVRKVPKHLVPSFTIPQYKSQADRDLVRWVGLVYYLAWELDTPYFSAMVEHNEYMSETGFFPWIEWPQPPGFDPRPFLIHQVDPYKTIEEWKLGLVDQEDFYYLPEIIDAYLLGNPMMSEFVASSLTAIDCLVYMLEPILGDRQESKKLSKPIRKRPTRSERVDKDLVRLKGLLRVHHDPRETFEKASVPLTASEIAKELDWVNEAGEPLQPKVSRYMAKIFGKYASVSTGWPSEAVYRMVAG